MDSKGIGKTTRLGLALLLTTTTFGCGDLAADGDGANALTLSAQGGKGRDPDCDRILDPRTDRDHRFHKRCERYQQKRRKRSAKAGNATLTTRVLMDAQRVTELEATTGSFDDVAAAPGKIEELRVDVARTSARTRDDRTVSGRADKQGGYVSMTLPNLVHGQSMTIAARINGIDKGPTKVSVADQVLYRPDLAIGTIEVPANPTVGLPVPVSATVRELMGDEGAGADCVLSVDGAAVDRASGIWVDSGSLVTCHFSYAFAAAGAHRVAVEVTNVAPRDYSLANNRAEIDVNAAPAFTFSGSVVDSTYNGEDVEDVVDASGAIMYHREDTWRGANQSASVTGSWLSAIAFPLAAVSATAASGGATWPLIALSGVEADPSDGTGATCASRSDDSGYNWLGICTTNDGGSPATQISVSAFAGEVTYHSLGVCQTTSAFYDCAGGYTWNSGSDARPTNRHAIVDQVTFALNVTDANGKVLQASPALSVEPFTSADETRRTCDPQPDGTSHCFSHAYSEMGVSGSAAQ